MRAMTGELGLVHGGRDGMGARMLGQLLLRLAVGEGGKIVAELLEQLLLRRAVVEVDEMGRPVRVPTVGLGDVVRCGEVWSTSTKETFGVALGELTIGLLGELDRSSIGVFAIDPSRWP